MNKIQEAESNNVGQVTDVYIYPFGKVSITVYPGQEDLYITSELEYERRVQQLKQEVWKVGKVLGCVVSNVPVGRSAESAGGEIEYYGGHLVCESIAKTDHAEIIAGAIEMRRAISDFIKGKKDLNALIEIHKKLPEI